MKTSKRKVKAMKTGMPTFTVSRRLDPSLGNAPTRIQSSLKMKTNKSLRKRRPKDYAPPSPLADAHNSAPPKKKKTPRNPKAKEEEMSCNCAPDLFLPLIESRLLVVGIGFGLCIFLFFQT